jgi:protocatechuate 3,4-dioxygenase beta subunit
MCFTDRRAILLGAATLVVGCARAQQAETAPTLTPPEMEGPFYPVDTHVERDVDLTRLTGRTERAAGQIIEVRGRVVDVNGQPVSGAQLELWQANAAGRYAHPEDPAVAPLDPNFQGYAVLQTGADGAFSFTSVKPGAYNSPVGVRTPHLHWRIGAGARRLSTQMYFPGEAQNETDGLMRAMGDPVRTLIAASAAAQEAGAQAFEWNVVLPA